MSNYRHQRRAGSESRRSSDPRWSSPRAGIPGSRISHTVRDCDDCDLAVAFSTDIPGESVTGCPADVGMPRRPLRYGEHLYWPGDRFTAIYEVRSGALKTCCVTEEGLEHVSGFYLPGELAGLDAIHGGRYPNTAIALEGCSVCEITLERLTTLAARDPALAGRLYKAMSRELFTGFTIRRILANGTAEGKLAIALLNLAERCNRRGVSPARFRLPMQRMELADYLGLAAETISRLFRRFQDNGWISASDKDIELIDVDTLQLLSA